MPAIAMQTVSADVLLTLSGQQTVAIGSGDPDGTAHIYGGLVSARSPYGKAAGLYRLQAKQGGPPRTSGHGTSLFRWPTGRCAPWQVAGRRGGAMNVPSWSPNSTMLAFTIYALLPE